MMRTRVTTRLGAAVSSLLLASVLVSGMVWAAEGDDAGDDPVAAEPGDDTGDSPADTPADDTSTSTESAPAITPPDALPTKDMSDAEVSFKMKDIGERVSELKEKVFRTKARLVLLQETILGTGLAAAKAVIVHRNEMGAAFRLEKIIYALDGTVVFSDASSDLNTKDDIEVWSGTVVPGNHQLAVELTYRGHGFGVFSYLNKYLFKIKSSYTFHAEEGKITRVNVVGYEKKDWTLPIEKRPTARYDVEVLADEGTEIK